MVGPFPMALGPSPGYRPITMQESVQKNIAQEVADYEEEEALSVEITRQGAPRLSKGDYRSSLVQSTKT